MPDQKFTRCPGCATVFRVTAAQLALREGQVRCGHCRAVFDANDHFVALDPLSGPDEFDSQDELARGRPTVTLRSADALQAVPPAPVEDAALRQAEDAADVAAAEASSAGDEAADSEVRGGAEPVAAEPVAAEPVAAEPVAAEPGSEEPGAQSRDATEPDAEPLNEAASAQALQPIDISDTDRPKRFEWKQRAESGPRRTPFYAAAIVVLVIGLVLQAVLEYRDALAAHLPVTRPLLAAACRPLGCTIGPLRDAAALSIDASDLQADPAHRGLLLLAATIRNRAAHAIAYPHLELTLTDSSDRVVVRRAFAPPDYAGGTADPQQGIPANGERVVRIFLDASATQQAGYRLYLFYP